MPVIASKYVPFTAGRPIAAATEPDAAGFGETLGAATTIANWPYRSWRYLRNRAEGDTDPDHNPFDMIRGTKYEADPERFAGSRGEWDTRAIMQEWDEDEAAMDTLSRSGRKGTVAMVGMGLLDPTVFLPVAKVFSGVKAANTALRIGADTALAGATGAAIAEGAMAATTPHYDVTDMAVGIGSATLLGGLLGTAAGALLSKAERAALASALDADRADWGSEIAASRAPQAAGAAVADMREVKLRAAPGVLSRAVDPTGRLSPTRRVLNSPFRAARRAAADLTETPYIFEDNLEGIATTQGPALDRLVKMETARARVSLTKAFDEAYARYRFGADAASVREKVARKAIMLMDHAGRPRTKASQAEFRSMVDEALRSGDTHAVPEVAEVARHIRRTILDPWRDRMIAAQLLPEDVGVATADSYMMRVWNKQKLIGERPAAKRIFADWLEAEEGKKAALQEELRDLSAQIDAANAKIAKLDAGKNKHLGRDADEAKAAIAVLENQNAALRQRIEAAIAKWDGNSAKDAKRALKARGEAEAARAAKVSDGTYNGKGADLTSADGAVDAAVKRILARTTRSRQELDDLADEIIYRIVGGPDGRLPYDAPSGRGAGDFGGGGEKRGPMAARVFMIPDRLIRDFLDTDAHNTMEIYLNTVVPDVLLTERFGDVRMTEALKRIDEEAAALSNAATTPAERSKIEKERIAAVETLVAMRDRIRHTFGFSSEPGQQMMGRVAATVARFDILTNLGGVTLSSLPDLAGIQWRYGFTGAFNGAWKPLFKALTDKKARAELMKHKGQIQALGIAAETFINSRAAGLHDVLDTYRPTSKFERGVKVATDKFANVNFLAQWTDFGKMAAAMVSGAELTKAARAVAKGKGTPRQIRDLAENGIDAAMAARIAKELDGKGATDMVAGVELPNTAMFSDDGARLAMEGAIARDVDIMIITPGAEKPLMMSKPVMSLILQYKTFVQAANERLLVRSMQARDLQVLQGAVSAIGLGIVAEYAYSIITDRDPPENAAEWIKQGVSRSGMLGWYQEANAVASKWTGGAADAFRAIGAERPDSRYYSRSTLGAVLGPTANKIESLIYTADDIANLDWSAQDTRRLRRMLPAQNLFYIRYLLDKLEAGVNRAAGVEPLDSGTN